VETTFPSVQDDNVEPASGGRKQLSLLKLSAHSWMPPKGKRRAINETRPPPDDGAALHRRWLL